MTSFKKPNDAKPKDHYKQCSLNANDATELRKWRRFAWLEPTFTEWSRFKWIKTVELDFVALENTINHRTSPLRPLRDGGHLLSKIWRQISWNSWPLCYYYIYRPQRSCGQGNISTPVCHSVHRGGGGGIPQGTEAPHTPPPPTRHTPPPPDQTHHPPGQTPPPGEADSGIRSYERPVCILLECILVTISVVASFSRSRNCC